MYYSVVADADIPRVQQSCGTARLKPTQGKVLHHSAQGDKACRIREGESRTTQWWCSVIMSGKWVQRCRVPSPGGRPLSMSAAAAWAELRGVVAPRGWGTAGIAHTFQHISAASHQPAAVCAQEARCERKPLGVRSFCVCLNNGEPSLSERMRAWARRHFLLSNTFLMKRSGPGNELLNIMWETCLDSSSIDSLHQSHRWHQPYKDWQTFNLWEDM